MTTHLFFAHIEMKPFGRRTSAQHRASVTVRCCTVCFVVFAAWAWSVGWLMARFAHEDDSRTILGRPDPVLLSGRGALDLCNRGTASMTFLRLTVSGTQAAWFPKVSTLVHDKTLTGGQCVSLPYRRPVGHSPASVCKVRVVFAWEKHLQVQHLVAQC